MSYEEAVQFLYGLRLFGANLGLENTRKLAALTGNPQDQLRFIHVAGTNGKGSTCAMLESIYRAAGLKVGLYTSPHLISFRERIQVNRALVPESDVVRLVQQQQHLLAEFHGEAHPTFFEVVTVVALQYFAEQNCELVIWETGLGGRLDATNIVTPLASVITNIEYDHQQWLGDTIEKIAAEKAGIIKPGVPLITAATQGRGLEVITETAQTQAAPLIIVQSKPSALLDSIALPLLGDYQRINAATALSVVNALQNVIPISEAALREGLENVRWPGRMQRIVLPSGPRILLDGAHNAAGAALLGAELRRLIPAGKPTIIFGVLQDKDWAAMASALATSAARIILTRVKSERGLPAHYLESACRAANPNIKIESVESLSEALQLTEKDADVVVTGSLYLVGEAIQLLSLSTVSAPGERELNEWTVKK